MSWNPPALLNSIPSLPLQRHPQIYFAVCPDHGTERHLRRCPNLRGPTLMARRGGAVW
jgi:hypothetical protein